MALAFPYTQMKPSLPNHRKHGSAARLFGMVFGALVLAGLLLLAMVAALKSKNLPAKKADPAATPSR
jgi:hypothetical protein